MTKGAQEGCRDGSTPTSWWNCWTGAWNGAARLPAFQDVVSDSSDHRSPLYGGESRTLRSVAASPIRCQCS